MHEMSKRFRFKEAAQVPYAFKARPSMLPILTDPGVLISVLVTDVSECVKLSSTVFIGYCDFHRA